MNWIVKTGSIIISCVVTHAAYALELPGLPQLYSSQTAELRVGFSTVGDNVNYSPNLADGGFATPSKRPRYYSKRVALNWNASPRWYLHSEHQQQRFTSLRDNFAFNKLSVGVRYLLPTAHPHTRTHLEFTVSSNRSTALDKNSYTQINDNLLTSLQIRNPRDLQWQTSISQTKPLTTSSQLTVVAGMGRLSSSHDGVTGLVRDVDGCNYDFDFGNNGGEINQLGDCGNVRTLNRTYPSDETIHRELGVAPGKDMQNNAWFYRVGGGLSIKRQRWTGQIAYYYQHYLRDDLDSRILTSGGTIYDTNHVLSLEATHRTTSSISLSASVSYNQHRFLDVVPVLYTRLTSNRFADDIVYFTFRADYAFSPKLSN